MMQNDKPMRTTHEITLGNRHAPNNLIVDKYRIVSNCHLGTHFFSRDPRPGINTRPVLNQDWHELKTMEISNVIHVHMYMQTPRQVNKTKHLHVYMRMATIQDNTVYAFTMCMYCTIYLSISIYIIYTVPTHTCIYIYMYMYVLYTVDLKIFAVRKFSAMMLSNENF